MNFEDSGFVGWCCLFQLHSMIQAFVYDPIEILMTIEVGFVDSVDSVDLIGLQMKEKFTF